jgi:hypothetical protein
VIISNNRTPNGYQSFSNADDVMMMSSSQKQGDMGYVALFSKMEFHAKNSMALKSYDEGLT